jgi:hypothetical protein
MATGPLDPLLHCIRRLAASQAGSSATDAEVLERFVSRRDEAAFTRLLTRHGPMASVPPGVLQATLRTALRTATVDAAATAAVSPPVAALAEGVLQSMFLRKLQTGVALVATTLLLAGSALLVHRATAGPRPVLAQAGKEPQAPGVAFSEKEFNELKAKLDVHNQPWASIPWQVSLTEARELAAKTNKPIFLAVGTGNPLGWG